jgi:hypothetical protein
VKKTVGQVLSEEIYQFVLWQCQIIEKFPRTHKFSIGDRLQDQAMTLLSRVVEATYTKNRGALLRDAQLCIEQMRFLFRLSVDLRLVAEKTYEHAARSLDAIGRGIGGWRKANDAHSTQSPVRADRDVPDAASRGAQSDPG